MRGIWTASIVISTLLIVLSASFAWHIISQESGAGGEGTRLVVDMTEFERRERQIDAVSEQHQPNWMKQTQSAENMLRLSASESVISWDLVQPNFRNNTVLVLRMEKPDQYERMCLESYLISNGVEHTIDNGEHFDIRLKTKEQAKARKLLEELATYDLQATLVVLNEIKPY